MAEDGPIRVVRLFSRLNVGGPAVHVLLLTAGLEKRGYRTELVVGHETADEGNMRHLASELSVVPRSLPELSREIRPLADLRALLRLVGLIRSFRPHVVHTHTAKAGALGRLAARWCGTPVVVHTFHGHVLRGYFGPLKSTVFRWLETALGGRTDALIAVSERVADELAELGVAPRERFRVMPLGLRLDALTGALPTGRLRAEAGFPKGATLVGAVGRLVQIKDLTTLLEAAAIARKSLSGLCFAIVGDGRERSLLEAQAAHLGLTPEAVHFYGWQSDLSAVYGDLDLVVNCSLNEGTPVALIEAMAAGKPVVATQVGGTPDLLGDGRFGRLVPPRDPAALARAMLETLGEPAERRAERVAAARDHVLGTHAADRLFDDIDTLYRTLLRARGVAA